MTPKEDMAEESELIIEEIESSLEKVLEKREAESDLRLKIKRGEEEAERKKANSENEIDKEEGTIGQFQEAISEFETARKSLQDRMRDHLERGMRYQRDIEKLTALTLEVLQEVGDLSGQLSALRQTSEKKMAEIRAKTEERFGGAMKPPAAAPAPTSNFEGKSESDLVSELDVELKKLKKIMELLESIPGPGRAVIEPKADSASIAEPPAVPEEAEFFPPERVEPLRFEPERPQAAFRMPEVKQAIDDFMKRENPPWPQPAFDESAKPRKEERAPGPEEAGGRDAFEALEKYRKTGSLDAGGEISYFENNERIVLDVESLIRAMGLVLETVRKQIQKLSQTESPVDQFFLRQELIDHQESLRQIFLCWVKMCETGAYSLPRFTSEILGLQGLKDILEKLNLDNWSNLEDVRSFETLAVRLKDAFYRKITPPADYVRSIIEELEV